MPGLHNALNAAGALEAARLAGAEPALAVAALAGFAGAGRRFQRRGTSAGGALVYDDYAHHPTEVAATLAGARTLEHAPPDRRLPAAPVLAHGRCSRSEFGRALAAADVRRVLDVYPARERAEDHPGVSGLLIAEAAADAAARPAGVLAAEHSPRPSAALSGLLGEGDLCVVMGAGDVDRLAGGLVHR